MKPLFWLVVALVLLAVLALGVLFAVTWIEYRQARKLELMQAAIHGSDATKRSDADVPADTALVYFSRSGNTALAARHVAMHLNAEVIALEVPDYRLGLTGLTHALKDAKALKDANALKDSGNALPDIVPSQLDMSSLKAVWLGSPVWLYSPAPPIWAFVKNNRFDGVKVVLFNTFNSHFGDDHIAEFKARVMARGAISFEHKYIKRGRMTQQLTPEEMLQAIDHEWFGD